MRQTESRSRAGGKNSLAKRASSCCGNWDPENAAQEHPEGQRQLNWSEAVGTADNQSSPFSWLPRNTGQPRGSERSQGREFRVGNWQSAKVQAGSQTWGGQQCNCGPWQTSIQTKVGGGWNSREEKGREIGWGKTVRVDGTMRTKSLSSIQNHT